MRNMDAALLVVRIMIGVIFIMHGGQKVFTLGLGAVAGMFGQMGLPFPEVLGPAVALLEFGGGIALLIGFATRLFAILLALEMLGAILHVHLPNGFFLPNGYEFALASLTFCLVLAIAGPGRLSVDALLARSGDGAARR
jgi:putative oxidoreductase